MAGDLKLKKYENILARKGKTNNIILLSIVITIYWFSQYIYMPFLTPHILSLGISASIAGVIAGAYGLTQLCFRFPIGLIADKYKNHLIIIRVGILLSLCSSIGFLIFKSPILLFISNFAQGLSSSTWLSFVILYSNFFSKEKYSKAVGLGNCFNQGGILISYMIGGILVDSFNIGLLFKVSCFMAIVAFTMTFFIKYEREERNHENIDLINKGKELFDFKIIFFSIMGLIVMFVAFATTFSFTSIVAENLGANGFYIAITSMIFTLSAAVGSYITSKSFIQKIKVNRLINFCFSIIAIGCILIGVAESIEYIMIAQILEGVGIYMVFSLAMSYASKDVKNENKSTAMGIFQTIYSGGIFLGPVFMGWLCEIYNINTSFVLISILPILGVIFNLFVFSKYREELL